MINVLVYVPTWLDPHRRYALEHKDVGLIEAVVLHALLLLEQVEKQTGALISPPLPPPNCRRLYLRACARLRPLVADADS